MWSAPQEWCRILAGGFFESGKDYVRRCQGTVWLWARGYGFAVLSRITVWDHRAFTSWTAKQATLKTKRTGLCRFKGRWSG
jgi:hypothetical protein